MFIEEPHALGRIHDTASAQSDDRIRFEDVHHVRAFFNGPDIRIRFDVAEKLDRDLIPSQIQLLGDLAQITELDHRSISYQEDSVEILTGLQILYRISFKIYFLRYFEPLHGISPFSDFLDIEQVYG